MDTETTGLDPLNGDRIVALVNRSPTGQTYHRYLCPLRDITADAVAVHGFYCRVLGRKAPPQQTRHGLTILK